MSLLWNASGAQGVAHGSKGVRVLEMLTYHSLLGAVMAALAGYALPGLATKRTAAAEAEAAGAAAERERAREPMTAEHEHEPVTARREPAEPVESAEPEPEPEPEPSEHPTRVAAAQDGSGTRTVVMDRPARTDAEAPVTTQGDSVASPAPVTMRRRRGGLFSRLRG
jgi:hypothetical protein